MCNTQDCEVSINLETVPLETISLTEDLRQGKVLRDPGYFGTNDFVYGEGVVHKIQEFNFWYI